MKTKAINKILKSTITSTDDFGFSSNTMYDLRHVLMAMHQTLGDEGLFNGLGTAALSDTIEMCKLFEQHISKFEK